MAEGKTSVKANPLSLSSISIDASFACFIRYSHFTGVQRSTVTATLSQFIPNTIDSR